MKKYLIFAVITLGVVIGAEAMDRSQIDTEEMVIVTDEFKRISSSELTPPVVEELLKQYPTSKLGAAYKNSKGEFKLIMVLKSGSRRIVYIDSYGNWLNRK
ncbi:hypothetical protein J8L85_01425 [Maribacter sp. MMG018]|uniref:hypothetical protein n=1 Tax=Maribacter sp. MMG018 TaxID=2822688 RepID=UPI001B367D52|nr:hypothetical protein [Maribacter sp. MMG018]MBQ4913078.1 hypothetical protein [Maribacter sp. MMG018]